MVGSGEPRLPGFGSVKSQDRVSSELILEHTPHGPLQWIKAKESDPDQNRSPEEVSSRLRLWLTRMVPTSFLYSNPTVHDVTLSWAII